MKKTQKRNLGAAITPERSPSMGDFAYQIIREQYRRVVKEERRVLSDTDPEYLHQMRVGTRRLRTALHVFAGAIALPKGAQSKRLSRLGKVLGKLRDLDVQTSTLERDYCPRLDEAGQAVMAEAIAYLNKQRRKAFVGTQDLLRCSTYTTLKVAYEQWLNAPQFKPMAQIPLMTVLPELLTPLLAYLLLHPAWFVSIHPLSEEDSLQLHDLRKAFKHVRYQAEFFIDFYGQEFQAWVDELKTVQDALGEVQDSQILLELVKDEIPQAANLQEFQIIVGDTQAKALSRWETVREKYLEPTFRRHLYQLILVPQLPMLPDPEQN